MNLEQKVGKDLTHKEIMEGFKQYLKVKPPIAPGFVNATAAFLQMIIRYPLYTLMELTKLGLESKSDEDKAFDELWARKEEKKYSKADCKTKEEREACDIAEAAIGGLNLRVALLQRINSEAKIPKEDFESALGIEIDNGIEYLKEKYRENRFAACKVNEDFCDKASEWLRDEIYARTKGGKEIKLLDMVSVRMDEQEMVYLNDLTCDWQGLDKKLRGGKK